MSEYYLTKDELYHHGVKGQKWGQRNYQNEDGSLTAAGRQRYGYGQNLTNAARTVANTLTQGAKSNKYHSRQEYMKTSKVGSALGRAMSPFTGPGLALGTAARYSSARKNAKKGVAKDVARDVNEFGARRAARINARAQKKGTTVTKERQNARKRDVAGFTLGSALGGAVTEMTLSYLRGETSYADLGKAALRGSVKGAAVGSIAGFASVGANYLAANATTNIAYRKSKKK